MPTTIEQALATVVEPSFAPPTTIEAEIEALEERRAMLLGVERGQEDAIRDRIARLEQDRVASFFVENAHQTPPLLSSEVLGWRHPKQIKGIPVPKLAPLSTNRPVCMFGASRFEGRNAFPPQSVMDPPSFVDTVPAPIEHFYSDVRDGIAERISGRGRRTVELSWRFGGVIPDEVRERTVGYMRDFAEDEIFLLAEAPLETWRYEEKRTPLDERVAALLDPLVVGIKAGRLWLLDVFDPTPIERYIADEFTS